MPDSDLRTRTDLHTVSGTDKTRNRPPESTNMTNPIPTPGHHIGRLPSDPETMAGIQAMHARGHHTILAGTWEALQATGIEPDDLTELEALA